MLKLMILYQKATDRLCLVYIPYKGCEHVYIFMKNQTLIWYTLKGAPEKSISLQKTQLCHKTIF